MTTRQPTNARPSGQPALRFSVPASVPGASPELLAVLRQLTDAANQAILAASRDASRRADDVAALGQRDASAKVYTSDTVARAGQFLRMAPPDSRGLALLLPSPDSTQPGDTISVSLEGPLGDLRVSCSPNQTCAAGRRARVVTSTVNGLERATFTVAGLIEFTSNGATNWSTAAEHPAESAATPGISPISSPEITPENTSGSYWRWVLRPFSVVLGRLAKVSGLTVLGNAAASLGAVGEVTASGARQALLSNASGTGIDWRAIEAADLPVPSPYGWDDALATNAHSGAHTPIVDSGQALNFASGATGITADGTLNIAATGPLSASGASVTLLVSSSQKFNADTLLTKTLGPQVRTEATATGANAAITWLTGGVSRLTVNGNGEWSNPAGAANQYWKWQSGAFPIWSSLALSDLPSQSADTFLGRLAGSGTPTAQLLSDIDSTSIVYDATSHTFQRAALTGDATASQNSNALTIANDAVTNAKMANMASPRLKGRTTATTGDPEDLTLANSTSASWNTSTGGSISVERAALTGEVTASANANATTVTRSTNFQSSPWTGQHQHNASVYYSGAFIGLDAKATVDAMSAGDIRKGGSMVIGSNNTVELQAGSGALVSGAGGSSQGWLRFVEGVASPAMAAGEGMYWVRGSGSLVSQPSFTDDTDVDHEIAYILDDDGKDSRTMARCILWEDFCSVQGLNVAAGFTYITCDTGWTCTNSAGGTATVSGFDAGASGTSAAPGELNIATGATLGTQIDFHKGQNNTTRWIRASDVKSLKFKAKVTSSTSVHITMGFNVASFGSNDCARFDFDSSVDTTIHVISADTAGATTNNTDSNITIGTGYREYEIRSPSASSLNWEYYIDGSLVATHTATSKTRGLNLHLSIANLAAANKDLRIDYVSLETWAVR